MPVHGGFLVEIIGELRKELLPPQHPESWVYVLPAISLGAISPKIGPLAGQNLDALLLGCDAQWDVRGVQYAHDPIVARQPQRVLEVIQLGRI
jgi:hypothetical protein